MRPSRALPAGAGAALIIGIAVLLLAAAGEKRRTLVSLDVPTGGAAAVLSPGGSTCEPAIRAPGRVGAVTIWTVPAASGQAVSVRVTTAGGPTESAFARTVAGEQQFSFAAARAALPRPVGPGPLRVCIGWRGRGRIVLGGASPSQLAIVLDAARPSSLLSRLPTALGRAALFHPGWVGAWTFWALLGGLLGALLLVVGVTARALSGELPPPAPARRSTAETRQRRSAPR